MTCSNPGYGRGREAWGAQTTPPPESTIYSPLADGQMRLVRILPPEDGAGLVACQLFAVDVAPPVEYAALSYVWGDAERTTAIVVNGQKLPVTGNLAAALWHFRQHRIVPDGRDGRPLPLWIDALCINQHDTAERGRQVAMMGPIYREAASVLSWLGPPGSSRIDLAFRVIQDIFPHVWAYRASYDTPVPLPDTSATPEADVQGGLQWLSEQPRLNVPEEGKAVHNSYWTAIFALGTADYWSRTWILQELVLARPETHYFVCGSHVAAWQQFWCFMRFLNSVRSVPLRRPERINPGLWALLRTRLFAYADLESAMALRAQPGPASYVYHAALVASASEPRDMVYALLSVVQLPMQPDYARTVREVYLDWFHKVLEAEGTGPAMGMLKSAGIGLASYDGTQDFPSWLPNLSQLGGDHAAISGTVEGLVRVAAPGLPKPLITPPGVLTVCGTRLMHVGYVLRPEEVRDDAKLAQFCVKFLEWTEATGKLASDCHPLLALFQVMFLGRDLVTGLDFRRNGYRSSPMAQAFYSLLTSQPSEGLDRLGRLLGTTQRSEVDGLLRLLFERPGGDGGGGRPPRDEERCFDEMLDEFAGQALIRTGQGQLGLAPPRTKCGDVVCVLDGCGFPVIMRRDGAHWVLIGACWVLGLMDGGPEDVLQRSDLAVEGFEIR